MIQFKHLEMNAFGASLQSIVFQLSIEAYLTREGPVHF